jgi:hypothetical protein
MNEWVEVIAAEAERASDGHVRRAFWSIQSG